MLHPQPGLLYLTLNRTSAARGALGYALKGFGGVSVGHGRERQQCVTIWPFFGWTTKTSLDTVVTTCEDSESRGDCISKEASAAPSQCMLVSMETAWLLMGAAALSKVLTRAGQKVVLPSRWTEILKEVSSYIGFLVLAGSDELLMYIAP